MSSTFEARQRRVELLKLHLIEGRKQAEIARRLNLTRTRVSQLINIALDDVVKGRIKLPIWYDISQNKTLVRKMLFYACIHTWPTTHERMQNFDAISQLTIQEQLDWVRKSGKVRWYK